MRILLKILLGIIILIAVSVSLVIYLPASVDTPDIKIEKTPQRLKRGEYLVNHVAACLDCHSKRDRSFTTLMIDENSIGANGEMFSAEMGFPGDYYPSNLTLANLKSWTDGELYNVLTTGVNKYGRVLFPVMPYKHYTKMSKEDIYSIIAYIRTLDPIETNDPESEPKFIMKIISKLAFKEVPSHKEIPPKSDKAAYGEYLVNAASCYDCHTPMEKGRYIEELAFSGGLEFKKSNGNSIYSSNITPDKETGIGTWDEEYFLNQFTQWRDDKMKFRKKKPGTENSEMAWSLYAGMTDEDIRAIYAYLSKLKPIKNKVETGVKK